MSGTRDLSSSESDGELSMLDPETERALTEALRSAWAPRPLDPALNEVLIDAALEDPLAPPSEHELVESERLRRALEGQGDHPDAALARALRTAGAPAPIHAERVAQLSAQAAGVRRGGNVIFVAFGAAAASAVAAAAAAMLFLAPAEKREPAASAVSSPAGIFVQSRSTTALFSEKFTTVDTSERIDRIAAVRARELRQNRYAEWGVR